MGSRKHDGCTGSRWTCDAGRTTTCALCVPSSPPPARSTAFRASVPPAASNHRAGRIDPPPIATRRSLRRRHLLQSPTPVPLPDGAEAAAFCLCSGPSCEQLPLLRVLSSHFLRNKVLKLHCFLFILFYISFKVKLCLFVFAQGEHFF